MTKIRIAYSRTPRPGIDNNDPTGTSYLGYDNTETYDETKDLQCLVFDTVDTKYADIFISQWKSGETFNNKRRIHFNTYENISKSMLLSLQQEMIDTIFAINQNWPEHIIPDDMIIELNENDNQLAKLNALHEYFEDVININDELDNYNIELYSLLEKINYLVHRMEHISDSELGIQKCLTVIRSPCNITGEFYKLQLEDYQHFEVQRPNVLYIDFATVGKDFFNCYYSNDVELVRSQKISPQEYIKPCMNFMLSNEELYDNEEAMNRHFNIIKTQSTKNAEQWLIDNDLTEYASVNDPKNTLGRLRLGTLIQDISYDQFMNMRSNYPYIYGVYIE